jgi:hypothetical protein
VPTRGRAFPGPLAGRSFPAWLPGSRGRRSCRSGRQHDTPAVLLGRNEGGGVEDVVAQVVETVRCSSSNGSGMRWDSCATWAGVKKGGPRPEPFPAHASGSFVLPPRLALQLGAHGAVGSGQAPADRPPPRLAALSQRLRSPSRGPGGQCSGGGHGRGPGLVVACDAVARGSRTVGCGDLSPAPLPGGGRRRANCSRTMAAYVSLGRSTTFPTSGRG